MPQISEITDEEARSLKHSFPSFSSTDRTSNYRGSENWEVRQKDFENHQRELKDQEERLAAEKKKLEEEMKTEVRQNQQQNQSDKQGEQGGGYFPSAGFWAFVIHILALGGALKKSFIWTNK